PGACGWHSQWLALGRAGDYSCHVRLSFVRVAARSASPLVAAWVKRSAGAGPKTPIASHSGRPPRMMRSGPTELTENAPGGIACPSGVEMSGADQPTRLREAERRRPAAHTGDARSARSNHHTRAAPPTTGRTRATPRLT